MPKQDKYLKHVETKKQKVEISEEEKRLLEKYAREDDEIFLTPEEKTVLEILTKRKVLKMITVEYNLAAKPMGKDLASEKRVLEILNRLKKIELVKSVVGADKKEYWVDVNYYHETMPGTEKL